MGLKRIISGLIIFSLVPLPVSAQTSQPVKVAVIELQHPSGDPALTQKIADQVRQGLEIDPNYRVLSRHETVAGLQSLSGGASEDLGAVVNRAKELYYQLDLRQSRKILEDRLARIQNETPKPEEVNYLVPAHIVLGMILQASGEIDKAQREFQEVARLAPETELSERDYPPKIRAAYERARGTVRGETARGGLKIASSPKGVKIFVNGVYKGATPVAIQGLIPGRHYVTVSSDPYQGQVRMVEVSPSQTVKVSFDLEEATGVESASLAIPDPAQSSEVVGKAALAGDWLAVDRVVLVQTEPDGEEFRATTRIIDVAQYNDIAQKTVGFVADKKGTAATSAEFVQFLAQMTPKKEKPAETLVAAAQPPAVKAARPFWKRPVVWIIGGLVLAGAGTGVGLAMSSGGGGDRTPLAIGFPVPTVTVK